MIKQNLLLEIITEDLPYKNSKKLIMCFIKYFSININKINLDFDKIEWELTYRRIVIKLYDLNQCKRHTIYNNNSKLQSINIILKYGLKQILINTIKNCNCFQKVMLLNDDLNKKITFIRPIINLLILLNNQIIKINFLKLQSNKITYSNKYIINNKKLKIDNFNNYDNILYKFGKVIINYIYRKTKIVNQFKKIENITNINIDYNSLIEEATFYKEWPIVIKSSFKERFLNLPQELIIYIMKYKQKFCPVFIKNKTTILPIFYTVVNLHINNSNVKIISENYSKIFNNLLTEIEFLFFIDRKKPLKRYLVDLKNMSFEVDLGNMFDKTLRIRALLVFLTKTLNINKTIAKSLALLSKCDLATNLVKEYPELRGLIGMCYSKLDNVDPNIYNALKTQYFYFNKINFHQLNIKNNKLSFYLKLVDTLDDLVGLISIHFKNKNLKLEQDPYEIRRKTLIVIQIIVFLNLNLNLLELINYNKVIYKKFNKFLSISSSKISNFIYLKYISWAKTYFENYLLIKSVTNIFDYTHNLLLIHKRIELLHKYFNTPYLNKILDIYKRINNLLSKVDLENFLNDFKINYNNTLANNLEKELVEVILNYKKTFSHPVITYNEGKNLITYFYKLSLYMENYLNHIKIIIDNVELSNHRIYITLNVKNLLLKLADINILLNK